MAWEGRLKLRGAIVPINDMEEGGRRICCALQKASMDMGEQSKPLITLSLLHASCTTSGCGRRKEGGRHYR